MKDVIFDLDGTLIDSRECIFGIYERLFGELDIPLPDERVMNKFIGPPIEYVIKDFLPENERAAACERFRALYREMDLKKANKLFDGVFDMLEKLFSGGKRLFIASTKNEVMANKICGLLGIEKFFTGIYGSRNEIGRLTKRLVLEAVIAENGIDKEKTVLIGDTHFDAEGAAECGIPVAMVKYGFGEETELRKYKIEEYFDTPNDVAEFCLSKE